MNFHDVKELYTAGKGVCGLNGLALLKWVLA